MRCCALDDWCARVATCKDESRTATLSHDSMRFTRSRKCKCRICISKRVAIVLSLRRRLRCLESCRSDDRRRRVYLPHCLASTLYYSDYTSSANEKRNRNASLSLPSRLDSRVGVRDAASSYTCTCTCSIANGSLMQLLVALLSRHRIGIDFA